MTLFFLLSIFALWVAGIVVLVSGSYLYALTCNVFRPSATSYQIVARGSLVVVIGIVGGVLVGFVPWYLTLVYYAIAAMLLLKIETKFRIDAVVQEPSFHRFLSTVFFILSGVLPTIIALSLIKWVLS